MPIHNRYSDDLDFFSHELALFLDTFRSLLGCLLKSWPDAHLEVDARDFKRILIPEGGLALKLDFVADRVARIGLPERRDGFLIDTVRNILSNKICAILGRDEARDMVDILAIARSRCFSWPSILQPAQSKDR